ncbi:hypothetical protein PGT21_019670 [Puccinia graminis f. sp. tritici]|uniref:Uncharacterized protein n=1 Tax=Puccinia graminis f. sp. tritici TaxID=56615 RepID=A0A5B0N141_PUCGR|nr:hypothetical protein PGT21_019670 [Puccinia graminis f. sp. tritici]KAA1124166.1 hypothetical protein PGTUg99_030882 [Puccinia graminis f. sp. tritici]
MYALQQQPGYPLFAEATYTLQIFDERGMGAGPTPGLMAHSSQNSPCPSGLYVILLSFSRGLYDLSGSN